MDIFEFGEICNDQVKLIKYLRSNNLLRSKQLCYRCNRWKTNVKRKNCFDNYVWKCPNKKCNQTNSIRTGSFFVERKFSRIPLRVLFAIIYFFAQDANQTLIYKNIGNHITRQRIGQWQQYLRDICTCWLLDNPFKIGGPGKIVQVDESKPGGKRKYNKGRSLGNDPDWLIGVYSTDSKQGCIQIVTNRNQKTCRTFLKKHVKPGSIIHSDEWKGYTKLQEDGFMLHETVCHKRNFKDPKTGAHTQGIEGIWGVTKARFKTIRGFPKHLRPTYIDEALYRLNRVPGRDFRASLIQELLLDIAKEYPMPEWPLDAPELIPVIKY